MEHVDAKCMLCGKIYTLGESDKDFKKMTDMVGNGNADNVLKKFKKR